MWDARAARWLAAAVDQFAWRTGSKPPLAVTGLVTTLADMRGHARTGLALEPCLPDDPAVPIAYTYEDAGKLLGGVNERTIRRLVERGELPVVEIGEGVRRIARKDLEKYVAEHRRERQPEGAAQ